MRTYWQEMPLVRILLTLIAGIALELVLDGLTGIAQPLLIPFGLLLLLGLAAVIAISYLKNASLVFRLRNYFGLALTLSVFSLAYILSWFYTEKNYSSHFANYKNASNEWVATITEPPVVRDKVLMAAAEINRVGHVPVTGKAMLSFVKDSSVRAPAYGDVILFKGKVEEIEAPKNPYEFDFKRYYSYKNIYHHAYLQSNSWKLMEQDKGNFFLSAVYHLRDKFLHIIGLYVKDKNDFAVASALMLGYRDYINNEVMRAYSSSGVIHVLSVSGFHVSILFLMLNFLLIKLDDRGKKWAVGKAIFIICFIWFYSCLTGMSPPVLRSALMFTLIQVGQLFFRNRNMFNLVSGSALLLLLFDPFLIMDVGFQLSYLAVFGIVYLYPKVYTLLAVKNNWLDKAWKLVAVSLAAQIATVPLSLYYFHQFPNLFLLANLVVIPLSEFILWAGTALFVASPIPYLNEWVGWVFNQLVHLLNKFIFLVDRMPFALVKGISITLIELTLVYALFFLLSWLSEERKTKVLLASLIVVFSLCSFHSYRNFNRAEQKKIIVYSVHKHCAIAFIDGFTARYYIDDELQNDEQTMRTKILPYWWACGINRQMPVEAAHTYNFGKLMVFEDKRILIVDSAATIGSEITTKLKTDLVILSGNPSVHISDLRKVVEFGEVVAEGSNTAKRVGNWKKECEVDGIKYWDVREKGAYIMELKN